MCEVCVVSEGTNEEAPMSEQDRDITARLRATIEEELGNFRQLSALPSAELELMADRLARAVAPVVGLPTEVPESRAA